MIFHIIGAKCHPWNNPIMIELEHGLELCRCLNPYCHNFKLGFVTKLARGMERWQSNMQPRSHIHALGSARECEGMSPHTPKRAPILGVGVPRDSQIFREKFEGSNLLDWICLYTIEKIWRCRCLKWACMIHLSIYNTSYGWKKG
jgi:hypothetical protein